MADKTVTTLKPCPFCGSDKIFIFSRGPSWKEGQPLVFCDGCGVEMDGDGEQEAIENWNKRTP